MFEATTKDTPQKLIFILHKPENDRSKHTENVQSTSGNF
jgi:hypothetical protein